MLLELAFIFLMIFPGYAVQEKDFWYKVESPEKKEELPDQPQHQFDSIESKANERRHQSLRFWSRLPKFSLGTGIKYDKGFADDEYKDLAVIATDFSFNDHGWNRLMLGGLLTFHSNFMVHFMWQFTPTRNKFRLFYGLGLGINWDAKKEIRTLVELESYQVVGAFGYEWLLKKGRGLRFELRGFAAKDDYGAIVLASYIWHL